MPCRDYEDDYGWEGRQLREQNDRLARIACAAMTELEANGIEDALLLKNAELREWWAAHKEADRKAHEAAEAKRRKAELKRQALAKLSAEELEALGIKKK